MLGEILPCVTSWSIIHFRHPPTRRLEIRVLATKFPDSLAGFFIWSDESGAAVPPDDGVAAHRGLRLQRSQLKVLTDILRKGIDWEKVGASGGAVATRVFFFLFFFASVLQD